MLFKFTSNLGFNSMKTVKSIRAWCNKAFLIVFSIIIVGCSVGPYPIKPAPEPAPSKDEYIGSVAQAHGWILASPFQPIFPHYQLHYSIEGWALMRFTIEGDGSTSNIEVIRSSTADPNHSFDFISIKNIKDLKYRTINGRQGKRTPGVMTVLEYKIEVSNPESTSL